VVTARAAGWEETGALNTCTDAALVAAACVSGAVSAALAGKAELSSSALAMLSVAVAVTALRRSTTLNAAPAKDAVLAASERREVGARDAWRPAFLLKTEFTFCRFLTGHMAITTRRIERVCLRSLAQ
jgi:hypothetical protein